MTEAQLRAAVAVASKRADDEALYANQKLAALQQQLGAQEVRNIMLLPVTLHRHAKQTAAWYICLLGPVSEFCSGAMMCQSQMLCKPRLPLSVSGVARQDG